jgi:uncharacterized membrane protein YkoI
MTNETYKTLAIAVVLAITATLTGVLASNYIQQASGQNQAGSNPLARPASAAASSANSNWTGSIQVNPTIRQAIGSQVHSNLSNAVTIAEKAVGANSHASSARLTVQRGFLVYSVLVRDPTNNSLHRVIVDPGNGKVLANEQQPSIIFGNYYHHGFGNDHLDRHLGRARFGGFMANPGMFKQQSLNDNNQGMMMVN